MKSNRTKELVKNIQRHLAQLDFALGIQPRKTSKTYTEAYARCYEECECMDALDYSDSLPF